MTPEQFRLVAETFDELVPLSLADRRSILDIRFAQDTALRAEVESLLAEHDRIDAPIATAAGLNAMQGDDAPAPSLWPKDEGPRPVLKGAYRLLRPIGEGGMGVVYEAEQAFPRRRVAVKSIRHGLSTPSMLRRFRTEIELLARLHHPGIAQIYEAGFVDEDSPDHAFFVMELVEGLPLHTFARTQALSTDEKVALMLKVCDAVQHAHQRGVIHRDLKPGNILVTASGEPKVLDFGVARAADDPGDATMATHAGQVIGTPSYMSPEQMHGEAIDTRADIYSLGVIFYELLTGALPFDFSKVPITEAARVLRERTSLPLSHSDRTLRGDLQVIVSTAMRTDRDRRYSSVAALADDIQRFRDNKPIAARKDSTLYVAGKLARRHWGIVSLACLLLASIIAFATYSGAMANKNAKLAIESVRARAAAESESVLNASLSRELASELAAAKIDRGRAEASAGRLKLAEDIVWKEHLASPESSHARWALWEMYHNMPCLWTVQMQGGKPAVAPDGSCIAMGSRSGTIELRRCSDGSPWTRVEGLGAAVSALAFTPEANSLLAGLSNGGLARIDMRDTPMPGLYTTERVHERGVVALAVSGDGTRAVTSGADKRLVLWDVATMTKIESWTSEPEPEFVLAVNADASLIVGAGRGQDSGRTLYRAGGTKESLAIPMEPFDQARWIAFSRDGESLYVSRSCNDLGVFHLKTKAWRIVSPNLSTMAYAADLSPDGRSIAIAAGQELLVVPLDDTQSAVRPTRSLGQQQSSISRLVWTRSGHILTASDEGEIRCFSAAAEPGLTRLTGYLSWCFSTAWSPDGALLAIDGGGREHVVFNAGTLERVVSIAKPARMRERAMTFLSNATQLLCAGQDGRVRLIDIPTGQIVRSLGEKGPEIYALSLLPDEQQFVTGHWDGSLRLWDVASGTVIREMSKGTKRIDSVALSPDAKLLAASSLSAGVQLFDAKTFEPVRTLETSGTPWAVAFSPDSAFLAVTTYTGTLDIFNLATAERRASINAHQRLAPGLAYSPDGNLLATGSEDGSIRLWDATSLRQLLTLQPQAATIVHLSFHPSSRYLAAGAEGRSVLVYDLHAMDAAIEGNRAFQASRSQP